MIKFTKHARERLKERHPEWNDNDCQDMARMAISGGKLLPGYNGCRRYRFADSEFVISYKNGKPVVVTVV